MRFWAWVAAMIMWAGLAAAQSSEDIVFVQIEAHPSLATATDRARGYAATLDDVNGFAVGTIYAVALGPYRRDDAAEVLRVYRAQGVIPRDSYLIAASAYRQQVYPLGANVLALEVAPTSAPPQVPAAEPEATPEPADETPAQARRSERQLTRAQREELQIALRWAGTYTGAIDGAYGRGTRAAMGAWQAAQGLEETGILTTAQRAELLRQYNAVLDGLGLQLVTDTEAGIEMKLPTAVAAFTRYESPFAIYDGTGAVTGAQVLLISQPGNQATLFGLYDIMQTLEIVPLDGPRERGKNSFTLVGENDRIVSETRARLVGGAVKGFTLIWPAGDEERRTRLIEEMEASFTALDGALDPAAGTQASRVDLVAGLAVRTPRLSRSGFFVDGSGTVVTVLEAAQGCTRITLDDDLTAEIVAEAGGIAVLRPDGDLAPMGYARLGDTPRIGGPVAAAGYSYEGVLSAPSATFGTLADLRGLDGNESVARLSLEALAGDAGGPVISDTGAVIGMLLPRADTGRSLPADVALAAQVPTLQEALSAAGIAPAAASGTDTLAPEDMAALGSDMTVLVSCWD